MTNFAEYESKYRRIVIPFSKRLKISDISNRSSMIPLLLRTPLSYRNHSTDLLCKYLRYERVKN